MDNLKLVVAMPVYNEQDCIKKVIEDWSGMLKNTFGKDYDKQTKIICVNDGSKDNSLNILQTLQENHPELLIIDQENSGHGAAILTAYKKALSLKSEYIFGVDSDDQFLTEDFSKLWEKRHTSDFILGIRQHRKDAISRLIITRILRLMILIFFGCYIKDANIPFRLIKGEFLRELLSKLPSNIFAPNIFLAILAKKSTNSKPLLSIPVTHINRKTGTVSIASLKLLKVCLRSVSELLRFRFSL